ncbi:MAG: hypothetical protein Q7S27_00575 [Nanoarchaeota archaeon]|nr:hypothetical protein [Nanoarchaeota archaeon]
MKTNLETLARNHNFVVLDPAILHDFDKNNLSNNFLKMAENIYYQHDNIITFPSAFNWGDKVPRKIRAKTIRISRLPYYRGLLKYARSIRYGNIDDYNCRISACTIALSYHSKKTAFVSSDQCLHKFINKFAQLVQTGQNPTIPKRVNLLDAYFFDKSNFSLELTYGEFS